MPASHSGIAQAWKVWSFRLLGSIPSAGVVYKYTGYIKL